MKKILIIVLVLYTYVSYSQNTEIDSLLVELDRSKEDTNKLKLYKNLLFIFSFNPPKQPDLYVLPAIHLSERLNHDVFEIKLHAGSIYWKMGLWDTALMYHFKALKLVDEKNNPKKFAIINIHLGQDYADQGNYSEALKYFEKARDINQRMHYEIALAESYLFISWVFQHQGNYIESSKSNMAALKCYEMLQDDYGIAIASSNLAQDYMMLDRNNEAILYFKKGLPALEREKDYVNLSSHHRNIARANMNLKKNDEALNHVQKSFYYARLSNDKVSMGEGQSMQADIYTNSNNYQEAVMSSKSAIEYFREVNARYLLAKEYSRLGICYVRLGKPELAKASLDSAAHYSKTLDSPALLSNYLNGVQLYDSLQGNWKGAYLNYYKYVRIRDSIYNADNTNKLLQYQNQYESDKKEAQARVIQEKKDIFQRTIRNSIAAILAGTLIFLVVVYRQRNKISKARRRSDELLLNILPDEVAEELKIKGSADAKHFDEVTVMFTDFKGFTQISEKLTPSELVAEIDTCFKAFDQIITKHNIEKIKTIGDAYMCAGGLPVSNLTHAENVVYAALEIQKYMLEHLNERNREGKEIFEIRIGIHTGPVVAGIVGVKKFAYDIWGDTVNIASRMESSSEAGKINISGRTYELVKDKFRCRYRGKIQAKNKGEIDMYFVEGTI
ncbi:MAG: tetratricopeptide repeat protein [Chitinophagaceae bacterium]|nr:tetratricopeptide repeat protein [Chitinophagaceae bacterium]